MAWFLAHYQLIVGIVLAVLPTLIVGLSNYPKAQGVLNWLLNMLSLVTHADSPGSLKLPLTQSKPPQA